ncbi:MAG: hypothetical protein KME23_08025 [Goleter apudmare HA4340-LM2]|jgi:vacuolar-type H+-ATPase subunit I/STV1|nr:hypothetical protein [Goleter apudmare HA4340-LM2]
MKNNLDIVLGLLAIAGMFASTIWKLAVVKAQLEKEIDTVKDDLRIHLTEYSGKKEFLDYHLHSLNEKIDHKFNRCWSEIRQNQSYLAKHGFVPREQSDL